MSDYLKELFIEEAKKALESRKAGGIIPTGDINITENGEFDVTEFAKAIVNVVGGGGATPFVNLVSGFITPAENATRIQIPEHEYRKGHFYIGIANTNSQSLSTRAIQIACCNGSGWVSSMTKYQGGSTSITDSISEVGSNGGYSFKSNTFLQAGVTYAYVYLQVV